MFGITQWTFNNTTPSFSVFSVGTELYAWNASSATYIAYCFADVKGFSKFGSYTGNGSADGTFVYTGFKPAFVMIKDTYLSSRVIGYIMIINDHTFNQSSKSFKT
jgi:hypothetical protein